MLDKDGLRPTPDRVRETVFNWLSKDVPGASVLDCFAGAGGLGLEAASREARSVTLVDKDREVAAHLKRQCERLQAKNTRVINADVLSFLETSEDDYELVFIDPPYVADELRLQLLSKLIELNRLRPGALIYLEWPKQQVMELNHARLSWVKQKTAGKVRYAIAQWGLSG